MQASELRRAFTRFFEERGHTVVPSAGLIPHHPTAPLFTNAGMNQFVPYFLGEERAPYPRATSVQKCIRTGDIENVGLTTRHMTFFEMLGNFSFGDYFKEDAIRFAWDLSTDVLGFDGDRIWVTVYLEDDESADIWRDAIGVPHNRIQRLGEEDNFWEMQKGAPGPCGPNSELHYDRGAEFGAEGGPAEGGEERYVEYWNLVFIEYNRLPDGSLSELPSKNVDTGAGFERNLALLQGVRSVFDTDSLRRIVARAESLTGHRYGADERVDVSLRIMADHARASAFMVSDDVFPTNEDRGYVLRRLMRRAVRHAYTLGVERPVLGELVGSVVGEMEDGYPELRRNHDAIVEVVSREEERFRQTLRTGSALLEDELDRGHVEGHVAFKLHDTYGFPIELTEEIAEERGVPVDRAGFDTAMAGQRRRAKEARKTTVAEGADLAAYRAILERRGPTEFVGYQEHESKGEIVGVFPVGDVEAREAGKKHKLEIFLDRTPFYAEGGGQIGDTGTIRTDTGVARVLDTTAPLTGLHRHVAEVLEGEIAPGQEATAAVDPAWREHTRRNHTGTHLLHAALRDVLGPHVRQQGSYVGPDRLRFDISHHAPVSAAELQTVEDMVNDQVLSNVAVRAYETTMEHARELGALMFFGDKYGDIVRVVEAGPRSIELCGGTHVHALGGVGPLKIVSEGSIGSNMRRVEAITGTASLHRIAEEEQRLEKVAELLRTTPDEVHASVERLLERQRRLEQDLQSIRSRMALEEARHLAASAENGYVIARRDGVTTDELKELALATRAERQVRVVVLAGSPDGDRVAVVAAVDTDTDGAGVGAGPKAGELAVLVAKAVGGGGNPNAEGVAVAGGRDPGRIDEALGLVRQQLGLAAR